MIPGKRPDRIRLAGSTIPWPALRRTPDLPVSGTVLRTPGFELVATQVAAMRRPDILDLGSPSLGNVEYLSQFSCMLHIGDVLRALADEPGMAEPEEERDVDGIVERVIEYEDDLRFDAIFVWDLFDYIDPGIARALMHRIDRHCRTGTLLYLTISTEETIPDAPGRFTIVDERHLRIERPGARTRSCMRHSPRGLERIMPGFRLRHSFLLANRMQDYLFSHA